MNWTGLGVIFPREGWAKIKQRQDFAKPGVYILVGYVSEDDDLPTAAARSIRQRALTITDITEGKRAEYLTGHVFQSSRAASTGLVVFMPRLRSRTRSAFGARTAASSKPVSSLCAYLHAYSGRPRFMIAPVWLKPDPG